MSRHTLTNYSLHSAETDSVLILQKLTYRTDTSVAEVIDIIAVTDVVLDVHVVINGSKNIFLGNMLRNKLMNILSQSFAQSLRIITVFLYQLLKDRVIYQLGNTQFLRIALNKVSNVYHHVGENLNILLLCSNHYIRDGIELNLISKLSSNLGSCLCDNLAC